MIEMRILQAQFADGYDFYLTEKMMSGRAYGAPVVMETATDPPGTYPPPPTLRLDESATQGVFEQLWKLGFRPHETSFGEGELKATKLHLEDFRMLTFDFFENLRHWVEGDDGPESD